MALPNAFLAELKARVNMIPIVAKRVKLARAGGGSMKGCCPFHGEKTPSFNVWPDHAHCYGCGWHGDAVAFLEQTQRRKFLEVVEDLARENGMEVPRDEAAQAEHKQRAAILGVLNAQANAWHSALMETPAGAQALGYLHARGITDDTIRLFRLGWVGQRDILPMDPKALQAAGLLRIKDGVPMGPQFRNRVMFPICDRVGRVIGFSGRVLDDAEPKYLNGSETQVYIKGRTLFGIDQAIALKAPKLEPLPPILVEGNLDVVALRQAGYPAVAPLGTALTADQLKAAWELSPDVILCFDADKAGRAAMLKSLRLALPLIGIQRTIRVVAMPEGMDPAALLQEPGGQAQFKEILSSGQPYSKIFYDLHVPPERTPEARAGFKKLLDDAVKAMTDNYLAAAYRSEWTARFNDSDMDQDDEINGHPSTDKVEGAVEASRAMIAIAIRHPSLIAEIDEAWAALEIPKEHDDWRIAILEAWEVENLTAQRLIEALYGQAFDVDTMLSDQPMPLPVCAREEASEDEARTGWWWYYARQTRQSLEQEIDAAFRAFLDNRNKATEARLMALNKARAERS